MKVKVTKEKVSIAEHSFINEGEYNVNFCTFILPDEFKGLKVNAVFNNITVPVVNNSCTIPPLKSGNVFFGVFAYKEGEEKASLIYSPKPVAFYVNSGSFNEEISEKSNIQL
ncbi:MAG: hypothetical protein IKC01_06025 [Clostridia bacterium]|nr:hypothetical protein [Clostridia bacterium]